MVEADACFGCGAAPDGQSLILDPTWVAGSSAKTYFAFEPLDNIKKGPGVGLSRVFVVLDQVGFEYLRDLLAQKYGTFKETHDKGMDLDITRNAKWTRKATTISLAYVKDQKSGALRLVIEYWSRDFADATRRRSEESLLKSL